MQGKLLLLFIALFKISAFSQIETKHAQIVSVIAKNHQKDSSEFVFDLNKNAISELEFSQNYLHFWFKNKDNPFKKSFLYKLEGLDYSWTRCDSCTNIQYANLDGGDYTFLVKTTEANDVPTFVGFSIDGNIWFKWWFIPLLFLYIVAFIGIGVYFFVIYKFRQKLIEQRNIHNHKMASMAELTSGIAHEIQNPLNFVNNFSEMSLEMAQELKDEVEKPDGDKGFILELTNDIFTNQQKIMTHGQRASGIVKRMLEHSNSIAGNFEVTEIKHLIENQIIQSLLLFKSKNVACNATYLLEADADLPQLKIIKQGINKVFINIFDNALYALLVKENESKIKGVPFDPIINIALKKIDKQVVIKVKDNGTGMTEDVKSKVFQPFFTTKPTGEGTGLGLSLAYDIISKGHGGSIECESVEGEGTTFIVKL